MGITSLSSEAASISTSINMKSMIFLAAFLALAAAQFDRPILIVKQSENRIVVSESGVQKQIGGRVDEAGTVSQGSYSFPEDGQRYTVNWVADENGFQAKGDHLPTPPPLPDHVVKLLQDLRAAGKL